MTFSFIDWPIYFKGRNKNKIRSYQTSALNKTGFKQGITLLCTVASGKEASRTAFSAFKGGLE
jgi:hypothetical protein